jgi:hypothetical protein
MKKIVLLLIGLLFLFGSASAYSVMIEAPDSLPVGKPLVVTGNTTYGIGTPIDVVLYFQLTTSTEVERKVAYIQSDKTFRTFFDTTGLPKGTYKVEVPVNGGGDSTTMRIIQLIDRSDEIQMGSPMTQNMNGKLYIAGTIGTDTNSGIQIEVIDPEGAVIFGPRYINTNLRGDFTADVPIVEPGDYDVSFTDANGYIGDRIITVLGEQTSGTTAPVITTTVAVVSARATASRDNPAYFAVRTGTGQVTIFTSTSVDWVVEYSFEDGNIRTVNANGGQAPESVVVSGNSKTLFVKVYPYLYSVTSDVTLSARNARSVSVVSTVPPVFSSSVPQTPTQSSPLSPGMVFIGLVFGVLLIRFGRR